VVLAGGGYGVFVPTTNGQTGDVSLGGGGGGVALGYAVVNNRRWVVYPSIGVGGFGYSLDVTNVSGQSIELGADETLGPGEAGTYEAGFLTVDIGISANRLLFFDDEDGAGGFAIGADAGFLTSVIGGEWATAEGVSADGLDHARLQGAYLRLTLGGGGFFFSD
jgi:hypothetical protein